MEEQVNEHGDKPVEELTDTLLGEFGVNNDDKEDEELKEVET